MKNFHKNLKRESKLDKNYKKHNIQLNRMICCINALKQPL